MSDAGGTTGGSVVATSRQRDSTATITKTTITPSPTSQPEVDVSSKSGLASFRNRISRSRRGDLAAAEQPYGAVHVLRMVMTSLLSALVLVSVGGAILMLLLWQQDRDSGVLTSQLDRTWDLFETLQDVERYVAYAIVPAAVTWIGVATINVRRATGQYRNPIVAALSVPIGIAGVWVVGAQIVADADDWISRGAGMVLQAVMLAVPLLALERVALFAECRRRPLRVTYVVAVLYLVHIQSLGGLSTIDRTNDESFGVLSAYLLIAALLLAIGTLSANESARAIEEGTEHRYQLRHRFGESLLAQAERG